MISFGINDEVKKENLRRLSSSDKYQPNQGSCLVAGYLNGHLELLTIIQSSEEIDNFSTTSQILKLRWYVMNKPEGINCY
jgi:hypothetical protein